MSSYEIGVQNPRIPFAFIARRLHSITGLFIVLFLLEHLLVNSLAASYLGDFGSGFIRAANSLEALPFVKVIEVSLLGVPILLHTWWGVEYLISSSPNSYYRGVKAPDLSNLPRNHAYTWQRITSIILLFGIFFHVLYMRFLDRPLEVNQGAKSVFITKLVFDDGLYKFRENYDFTLYDQKALREEEEKLNKEIEKLQKETFKSTSKTEEKLSRMQNIQNKKNLLIVLREKEIKDHEVIAASNDFGLSLFLAMRDAFKSPTTCILYTIFVLAACFHAMNGVWTFAISWGVALTERSRVIIRRVSNVIMLIIVLLGLSAIWGTYWI